MGIFQDSFLYDNTLCIITSYCEEGDLFSSIREKRKSGGGFFPQQKIVDWFIQIAMGLDYIHSKKVLHRDLKVREWY